MKIPQDMQHGCIHDTKNFGKLKIVKYNSAKSVLVEFLNSGWIGTFRANGIRSGRVKDLMQPSIFGVGFIGEGVHSISHEGNSTGAYSSWCWMLYRCYSEDYIKRFPTYRDCEVCEEWQEFQSFADWYNENHPNDGKKYHLDKDIKVSGNKIYSPENCMYVSPYENISMARGCYGRVVKLMSPSGDVFEVTNIMDFCRRLNLKHKMIQRVVSGSRKSSHGWTLISTRYIS